MKTQASKVRRGARRPASRPVATRRAAAPARPGKAAERKSAPRPPVKAPPPPPSPETLERRRQRQQYEGAIRLFQAKKYDRADSMFQQSMLGPDRAVAHHAQVHSQICRQRRQPPEVRLKTADDHYNYGVTLMNAGRLQQATQHLEKAMSLAPRAGYVHYALAASLALQGQAQASYDRLRSAIDLDPRNRSLARSDGDFARILDYAPLASLLHLAARKAP